MTPDRRLALLRAAEAEGTLPGFVRFWSHEPRAAHPGRWVLSQWWEAPFELDGVRYATAEAYLMAEKARTFGDERALAEILAAPHPGVAKEAGRRVTPFDAGVWAELRYDVAVRGNLAKFGQHEDLRAYLLSTAPQVLVEASPVDAIWGIGLAADDPAAERPLDWPGTNLLGFALMEVRARLA